MFKKRSKEFYKLNNYIYNLISGYIMNNTFKIIDNCIKEIKKQNKIINDIDKIRRRTRDNLNKTNNHNKILACGFILDTKLN